MGHTAHTYRTDLVHRGIFVIERDGHEYGGGLPPRERTRARARIQRRRAGLR